MDDRISGRRAILYGRHTETQHASLRDLPELDEIELPPQLRPGYLRDRDLIDEELRQP